MKCLGSFKDAEDISAKVNRGDANSLAGRNSAAHSGNKNLKHYLDFDPFTILVDIYDKNVKICVMVCSSVIKVQLL